MRHFIQTADSNIVQDDNCRRAVVELNDLRCGRLRQLRLLQRHTLEASAGSAAATCRQKPACQGKGGILEHASSRMPTPQGWQTRPQTWLGSVNLG
jgi:hypothetical protein